MIAPAVAVDAIVERYLARTPASRALWQRAAASMPLGVSANLKFFAPYPVALDRADGAQAWDVDGNEYVDLTFGAGAHLLGHRHPSVQEAVHRQLDRLVQHLLPDSNEVELAERLRARYPQLERIRFANTGSEAMRNCIRVARAVTGRSRIAKIEGHYHGSDDGVLFSSKSAVLAGTRARPLPVADTPGLARGAADDAVILPWNDAAAATAILDEHAADLACVVLEPIGYSTGGAIATDPAFAAALRERCSRHGILLIYDEIVTAHRLGPGGAARWLGVEPDLTGLGKAIGGGFPVSAFGGRADLMEAALGEAAAAGGRLVFASGTFTANPVATAAGLAVLDVIEAQDPAPRMNVLAQRLRAGLQACFDALGVQAWAVGAASITQVHFAPDPPRDRRDVVAADTRKLARFLLGMVAEGVLWTPVHSALTCAVHSEDDIDAALGAAEHVLALLGAAG